MPTTAAPARAWKDWVGLACRLVLGGVLLVAGILKAVDFPQSILAVMAYKILPYDLAVLMGYGLPLVEIAIGALLILGLLTRVSGAGGALLMAVFIGGIASAWARGLALDCGCFGGGGEIAVAEALKLYPQEIARDLGLMALGVWLAVRPRSPFSLDARLFPPLPELDDVDDETSPQPAEEESRA